MLSLEQGSILVSLARKSIGDFISGKRSNSDLAKPWLSENLGVFTTIETYPKRELRGCIGFPLPGMPLGEAVIKSARSACQDSRFEKLQEKELNKIILEISVLTKPVEIKFSSEKELLGKITPGKDGMIIEYGFYSGLFLPQVWEHFHSKEEFLDNLCLKASLPPGTWKVDGVKISKFNAQIFMEEKPNGNVIELKD